MNCAEVAELLGAYALDALPQEEKAEVERHLATCNLHPELVSLLSAAATVPFTTATEAPAPELRGRILAAIAVDDPDARPGDPPAAPALREQRAPVVIPLTPARSRRMAWAPYALAAAFAVLSLGLLAWNVVLLTDDGGGVGTRLALFTGDAGSGAVLVEDGEATVRVAGLPSLGSNQTYQLWVIEGGSPEPAGTFTPDASGAATRDVDGEVPAGAIVAITVEPAGGSDQPTSAPILVALL